MFALIEILLLLLYLLCYSTVFLFNPGLPVHKPIPPERLMVIKDNSEIYCKICDIEKKPGANTYHCDYCNICIEGYDHHCPWTSKCIGRFNKIPFFCFIFSVGILIHYVMIVTAIC